MSMPVMAARHLLETTRDALTDGYARDLINGLLDGNGGAMDDDALFRTMVLDENWDVPECLAIYSAAGVLLDTDTGRKHGPAVNGPPNDIVRGG